MTENIFRNFNDLVLQMVHQFFIWQHLQRSEYNSAYNARRHYWVPVITTLQHAFLLNLANIFGEKDKRILSVFTFLDKLKDKSKKERLIEVLHGTRYKNAIERLCQWRNNFLAHKNMHFVLNPKELTRKFPFTYTEIQNTFELLTEILNETKRDFDPRNATDYSDYYRMLNDNCREHTDFVLNNGLHTEAYNKLKKQKE